MWCYYYLEFCNTLIERVLQNSGLEIGLATFETVYKGHNCLVKLNMEVWQ